MGVRWREEAFRGRGFWLTRGASVDTAPLADCSSPRISLQKRYSSSRTRAPSATARLQMGIANDKSVEHHIWSAAERIARDGRQQTFAYVHHAARSSEVGGLNTLRRSSCPLPSQDREHSVWACVTGRRRCTHLDRSVSLCGTHHRLDQLAKDIHVELVDSQ